MKIKKPDYYKSPLRSRRAIMDYILLSTSHRYYSYKTYPLCFNVKLYKLNLEFDHLLEVWRNGEGAGQLYTQNEEWLKAVRERYNETKQYTLREWGVEDASRSFTDEDEATFRQLWDGTELDVEYSFQGRSCGWLSIDKFEGTDFTDATPLADMDWPSLRKLYQLVVMLKHDLENPEKEVEYQAAFAFFENVCSDIPRPNEVQRTLEFETV
jgi:hypothetical protein